MLFLNSFRADLSSEFNGPDRKVVVWYSLGNLSSFTHANAAYQNIKVMNLRIWLAGNSSCSTFISLCNKLPHPWLTITRWWMLMQSFSSYRIEQYCKEHLSCEAVFSCSYTKAELLILYTRDTAQAIFLLLLIQQERQGK